MSNYENIQQEVATGGLCDNFNPHDIHLENTFHHDFFYPDNLLPYLYNCPPETLLSSTDYDDYYNYYYSKRQKSYNDQCYSNFVLNNGFQDYPLNTYQCQEYLPEQLLFPTTNQVPPIFTYARGDIDDQVESVKKPSLSAQSVTARERRRKISDKTHELGKLIPGGTKMNTSEMLQTAFKYVNYLQAQVGILQTMAPIMESKDTVHVKGLQLLLASTTIQEKLCLEEKCLIPIQFLQLLSKDHNIQSNPSIFKDIDRLLQSQTTPTS
ncbi:hypothetical protein GIB67_038314 [Kingdonia uniflora]|uniref:BHLH domain-containing protein n=1 Tax=Kingdonia uniflora TaxID=39325 RepID=A0A7J7KUI6_9MAGN|nr:hypothetical protein GIB67_038314 [Kingdonia uniflora]